MNWLSGIAAIAWDLVKWCARHPFHVACVALALAAWHYRDRAIDVQLSANATISALETRLAAETARADTERANAAAAETTNANLTRQLDGVVELAHRNLELRRAAEAQAQTALRKVQELRKTMARLSAAADASRDAIYANDPDARQWGAVRVPAAIADRLRAEAPRGPPG